jgi:hypothetical protein
MEINLEDTFLCCFIAFVFPKGDKEAPYPPTRGEYPLLIRLRLTQAQYSPRQVPLIALLDLPIVFYKS